MSDKTELPLSPDTTKVVTQGTVENIHESRDYEGFNFFWLRENEGNEMYYYKPAWFDVQRGDVVQIQSLRLLLDRAFAVIGISAIDSQAEFVVGGIGGYATWHFANPDLRVITDEIDDLLDNNEELTPVLLSTHYGEGQHYAVLICTAEE